MRSGLLLGRAALIPCSAANVIILWMSGMSSCGVHSASLGYKLVFLKPTSLELCGLMNKLQSGGRSAAAVGQVKLKTQGPVRT